MCEGLVGGLSRDIIVGDSMCLGLTGGLSLHIMMGSNLGGGLYGGVAVVRRGQQKRRCQLKTHIIAQVVNKTSKNARIPSQRSEVSAWYRTTPVRILREMASVMMMHVATSSHMRA
mmetsp:Transcript_44958/g.96572  ORF Transcript_44958/g.96572 Transcript_44958/m.96572 type:complete len:116 (-) Transcript_44958:94-441(-)